MRPSTGWLPRPLDPVRSIKLKLGLILLGRAGGAGLAWFSLWLGWLPLLDLGHRDRRRAGAPRRSLAHGMTSPLREMTAAARAMARGDYTRRVRATSRDEVGELAGAFNQMAADLAAADRQRRELIANVSHELRTPITALQGVLENIVDGVAAARPGDHADRAGPDRAARPAGHRAARPVPAGRRRAAARPRRRSTCRRSSTTWSREAAVNADGGRPRRPLRRSSRAARSWSRRPGAAAPGLRQPARQRRPAQPAGRHGARSAPSAGTTACCSRSPTRATGIPPAERDRVFERFTRGERAAGGGTGLGLAIARWVVQLHDGTIAVVDPADGPRRLPHPRDAARCEPA